MYNHEPETYICPFCRIVRRLQNGYPVEQTDVIWQNEQVTAFLSFGRWQNNPLDVLVIPNTHIENIYDLPIDLAAPLQQLNRVVAIALKAVYRCDGVTLRQHNETAGNQDVWHYHTHITPRFDGDGFYTNPQFIPFPENERLAEAARLRLCLLEHGAD